MKLFNDNIANHFNFETSRRQYMLYGKVMSTKYQSLAVFGDGNLSVR